jgi:hypothetical protein
MASEMLYFAGKCKWAQVYKPDDEYDNFKINVYLDKPSMELFKNSGLQLTPKEDEDGTYVTFRRPNYKQIKKELVHFGAPEVVDTAGEKLTDSIGNGSDVVIKVVAYTSVKGKGHRLEAVKVTNLIPYEGSGKMEVTTPKGVEAF